MKNCFQYFIPISLWAMFSVACQQKEESNRSLVARIDSLQKKLDSSYKPGFGEFMSSIQVHHAKLWFAGQNENWKLADFEIHEIMETLEDLRIYETERKESKMISMLDLPLDSVNRAIAGKNPGHFRSAFVFLTNTCNHCHEANDFGFNLVKIPDHPPFDNQDFRAPVKK